MNVGWSSLGLIVSQNTSAANEWGAIKKTESSFQFISSALLLHYLCMASERCIKYELRKWIEIIALNLKYELLRSQLVRPRVFHRLRTIARWIFLPRSTLIYSLSSGVFAQMLEARREIKLRLYIVNTIFFRISEHKEWKELRRTSLSSSSWLPPQFSQYFISAKFPLSSLPPRYR